ncbi:MAG TPA: LytTR family DNA-binding domain-containing protein [Candidatus Egerieousia sp.]|mgnify:CR=1 FL=1|nr:LytTR family DNA-binding domain-containing protein [Candidatus Egerieousia sp.]HPT05053.1 LytTR family DNA-binding domain-containing protein [Candidatus Egerieousia sp.]
MNKLTFHIVYWGIVILLLSLMLLSKNYKFIEAIFISCSLLPGVLLAQYLKKDISFKNKKEGIKNSIFLTLTVLTVIYLGIFCAQWYLRKTQQPDAILLNPVFILLIAAALIILNSYLEIKIFNVSSRETHQSDKTFDFISDRKKITIKINDIIYIESNDDEVWIHTIGDTSYRTKMKISRWSEVMDEQFERIHRSYIVNTLHITERTATYVIADGKKLEISRKYRQI